MVILATFGIYFLNKKRKEQLKIERFLDDYKALKPAKGKEISIHIEKEIDRKIVKKVTVVGLWCVQWNPADRPSMKVVIQMLEGENVPAMPPNPFDSPEPIAKAIVEGSLFDSEIQTSY
nr:rust resistance kinase Lr10-like [Ipomoea batatas]